MSSTMTLIMLLADDEDDEKESADRASERQRCHVSTIAPIESSGSRHVAPPHH
jgi:hypothetical protein